MGEIQKNMKLYQNTMKRVMKSVESLPTDENGYINPKMIYDFATMHYHGVHSVKETIMNAKQMLKENEGKLRVLDVGSGLGGPAIYMEEKLDCEVTAVEYQKENHDAAVLISKLCGIHDKVEFVNGDFLTLQNEQFACGKYDILTSYLVFLHIDDKATLFRRCSENLKPGGILIIEDFFSKENSTDKFSEKEVKDLSEEVFCKASTLLTKKKYKEILGQNDLEAVEFMDMTEDWSPYCKTRHERFVANREKYTAVHGHETYKKQETFTRVVRELFKDGHGGSSVLGGCRIFCRKKSKTATKI